ncbi:unnamed protein product [Orchesella dallaii]|uniref:peptidylprolyl isomerase n=1 Tax=Orchesella dallaii TaxID=48710 RepID=A0ABP1QWL1_9HEXA
MELKIHITLTAKSPNRKKTKGGASQVTEDSNEDGDITTKKLGRTLASKKISEKTSDGGDKIVKSSENANTKAKKLSVKSLPSSDEDSAPKGRTIGSRKKQEVSDKPTTIKGRTLGGGSKKQEEETEGHSKGRSPATKTKKGEAGPKGRTLITKTKKPEEQEAGPKGRTLASKTKKLEANESGPKGRTLSSSKNNNDEDEAEPTGRNPTSKTKKQNKSSSKGRTQASNTKVEEAESGPKGRTLTSNNKKTEVDKTSPIQGRMLAPGKKSLPKAEPEDEEPPESPTPAQATKPEPKESAEEAQELVITTTPKPMKKWGPTKNGTYTTEGIYIETVYKPDKCDKVSGKGDYVTTEYIGQFPNGKKFDSTFDREEPMRYRLGDGQVIEGSEIATLGMCVGEIRRTIIPPKYGYGDKKYGQIPAGSTLHFEITLTELMENPFKIFEGFS